MAVQVLAVGYLLLMHLVPLASMVGAGGLVPGALLADLFAAATFLVGGAYVYRRTRPGAGGLSPLDGLVLAYIALGLASYLLFFQYGHPSVPAAFAYGLHYLLLPIPLYFVGKSLTDRRQERVIDVIVLLNLAMALIGIAMFWLRPSFYTEYLRSYYALARNYIPDEFIYLRLTSYMGSTAVGILAALTIVLAVRRRLRLPALMTVIVVMTAAALLSQQRGGIVVTAMALAYYLVAPDGRTAIKAALLLVGVVALGMAALSFEARYGGLLAYGAGRFGELGSAFSERAGSYLIGWRYFLEAPFGLGLGATSAAAFNAGLNFGEEVTDANFLRILADLGAIGLVCFLAILAVGAHSALTSDTPAAWLLLLGVYFVVALGTNVFDSYYVAHLFWLLLGVIDSRRRRGRPDAIGRRRPPRLDAHAPREPVAVVGAGAQ